MPLIFLERREVPKHLVCLVEYCLVIDALFYLILCHVITLDVISFIPVPNKKRWYVKFGLFE